jgi:hypothetical protein
MEVGEGILMKFSHSNDSVYNNYLSKSQRNEIFKEKWLKKP